MGLTLYRRENRYEIRSRYRPRVGMGSEPTAADLCRYPAQSIPSGYRSVKSRPITIPVRGPMVEFIWFPLCHNCHWYLSGIGLRSQQFYIGEGYRGTAPPLFCEKLRPMLDVCIGLNTDGWSLERLPSPRQIDGSSCGVIVLEMLKHQCLLENSDITGTWTERDASAFRLSWLDRFI